MLNIITVNQKDEKNYINKMKSRSSSVNDDVTKIVAEIINEVRERGDEAVKEYTLKFDKKLPENFEVSRDEINDALTNADKDYVDALLNAQANITEFHQRQKQQSYIDTKENGVILGQRIRGLDTVGIYVPGGTAAYPSSVLMDTIPAKIAGVREVIMVTPPMKNGKANPDILVAAAICGVDRIFLMGGAQAIAAISYGTQTVPKVDKIVGPGNIFVATAKKMLFGEVDIDMIAG
ncbi:MAG: histidinol dehydrogenase, partial [Oscillospiraceae bacterium]